VKDQIYGFGPGWPQGLAGAVREHQNRCRAVDRDATSSTSADFRHVDSHPGHTSGSV